MARFRLGKQTIVLEHPPTILSAAAIGGKKEAEGPLSGHFDETSRDTKFGQDSWEKAERQMQTLALQAVLKKAGLQACDVDLIFAGDLLNQCISSSFSLRDAGIPFFGLYGACSTMAEGLALASMTVSAGYAQRAMAMTSSHFASAERQYRFPLVYGGQRTPTAQWTVTGAGCALVGADGDGPFVTTVTAGKIVDWGIKDANNMGAAMAPAAYQTIAQHLEDRKLQPQDYDLIVTGDLGSIGKRIVMDLFDRDGVPVQNVYDDCGVMIFDAKRQDVHAGGSGCGCSAAVFCGYLFRQLQQRRYRKILFCGSGALLSPTSTQQGESIPSICHAVSVEVERS
ncbi:MAG: stage V sporulation protein AD [Oscillospiraceae bacterium]|nr:stage V sporulation protein AD [Oscillospiraceae bacterium]